MRLPAASLAVLLLAAAAFAEEDEQSPRTEKVAEWSLPKPASPTRVRFGPTGRWLLVAWNEPGGGFAWHRFRVYSLPDARLTVEQALLGSAPPVFDRQGRWLAWGVEKQGFEVHLWDLQDRAETTTLLPSQGGSGTTPTVGGISGDARLVAIHGIGVLKRSGERLDSLSIYDLKASKLVYRPEAFCTPYHESRAAIFGDGFALCYTRSAGKGGRRDYRLSVFDLAKGREIFHLPTRVSDTGLRPVISPDGRCIYSGDSAHRVRRYDLATGRSRGLFTCPKEKFKYLLALTLSSNGLRLAAWPGEGGPIFFYDLEKRDRFELDPGPKRRRLLGLSADGRYAWLATSTEVGVYDIEERKWRAPLLPDHAATARVDPTGRWLLTLHRPEAGPRLTLYRIK